MKRVLCIDDDPPVLELLRTILVDMGCEVTTAEDGAEGLALYEKQPYDLVVADLLIPRLDGLRLAEEIRARNPSARILVITAITHSLAGELAKAPIDGYFPKPLPVSRFKASVSKLLGAGKAT